MIKHYRGDSFIQNIEPVSAQLKRGLMGPFLLEFELPDVSAIYVGDSITLEWNNETFTFIVREINERRVIAEHKSYVLRNYAVVDKYLNDPPTYDTLIEFADITLSEVVTFLSPLFADAGFSITNNSVSSERKDITFNNDNLLSAIQKVCETFKVEFVAHDGYIQIVDQYGTDTGLTVNAGIHTESIKKRIDRSNIVTRIYPIGSSENLPEGYYYTALRPTTFDLSTKTHSGNLYVDNTEAQQLYGIIEKIVEFPHVKVKSKRGTVSGVGSASVQELGNKTYPYIYDANMNIPDPDKAKSATLFVKNGLKAAELPIVHIDVENKRIYYNPTLRDGSTLSWSPEVGSEYILVGYITQDEMNAARDELIAEAQRYLEENADPKVSYEIANLYIPDGKVFDVGDSLHLKDDSAGIDTTVRVLEFSYDLVSKVYRALKLSNSKEKLPYDILREQAEQKRQIEQIKLQVSESWQTARDALERHNLLVRNNFYGSENEYLVIGSEARNYALKGLTITPDDGTAGKVSWTGFTFQHINETTEYTCGSGNQQLSVGTYYLYIQIKLSDPANASGMNKLVFSSTPLENTAELNYYALGMAEFDGTRTKVATSYGFTLIDGNFIKTGTIQADKIAVGAVTSDAIQDGAITVNKIQDDAVTSNKIQNGAVTAIKIENGAVTTEKIQDGAVTNQKIEAGAKNYNIKGLTITPDDVVAGKATWTAFTFQLINSATEYSCSAGNSQLTSGIYYIYVRIKLTDPSNSSGQNTLVFSATPLTNGSDICYYPLGMADFNGTRTKIAVSYGFTLIDGNFIKTGTILADKLGVNELSAISANAGTITAGTIQGSTGTTKFDLNNDRIEVGSGLVKIGKGVLSGGGDGILLNAANLEVNGEIATRYIRLTDSVIVDLQNWEYLVEHTITSAQQNYLYTFSADIMRDNVTIWTPLGSKAYIDRVPIQISVYFNWGTSIVGSVTLSVKINSTEVFHYYEAGYGNVVDTVVKDIFKNYSVPIGSKLYVTVLPRESSQISWTLRVAVPKTLFIVPVR